MGEALTSARNQYPRLYLLNDQDLTAFMSRGADFQIYLKQCFPQIREFQIKDGSV